MRQVGHLPIKMQSDMLATAFRSRTLYPPSRLILSDYFSFCYLLFELFNTLYLHLPIFLPIYVSHCPHLFFKTPFLPRSIWKASCYLDAFQPLNGSSIFLRKYDASLSFTYHPAEGQLTRELLQQYLHVISTLPPTTE